VSPLLPFGNKVSSPISFVRWSCVPPFDLPVNSDLLLRVSERVVYVSTSRPVSSFFRFFDKCAPLFPCSLFRPTFLFEFPSPFSISQLGLSPRVFSEWLELVPFTLGRFRFFVTSAILFFFFSPLFFDTLLNFRIFTGSSDCYLLLPFLSEHSLSIRFYSSFFLLNLVHVALCSFPVIARCAPEPSFRSYLNFFPLDNSGF